MPHPPDLQAALSLLADHTSEVACLQDAGGRICWIAPAVQALLGFSPEALQGRGLETLVAPVDHPRFQALLADGAAAGPASSTLRMLRADGEHRWMALTLRPADPQDPAAGLVSHWRDSAVEVELRKASACRVSCIESSNIRIRKRRRKK